MSNGQGQRVSVKGSSIVTRLTSRSITGQDLAIEVHQHCGTQLHFIWKYKNNGTPEEACMGRNSSIIDSLNRSAKNLCEVHSVDCTPV